MCALLVIYVFQDDLRVAVVVAYSFWLPQILKNARDDATGPLHPLFVYGTALNRLALPFYCFGSDANVLRVLAAASEPARQPRDLAFCVSLALWQAAQVAVLRLQDARGPRWFVPQRFLPVPYDYRRCAAHLQKRSRRDAPPASSPDAADFECSICMADIDVVSRDYLLSLIHI